MKLQSDRTGCSVYCCLATRCYWQLT